MTIKALLVTELRAVGRRLGPQVTLVQFCREIGVSPATVTRFGGSWSQLRVAAGLPAKRWSPQTVADVRRLCHRCRGRQWRATGSLLMGVVAVWLAIAPLRTPNAVVHAPHVTPSDKITAVRRSYPLIHGAAVTASDLPFDKPPRRVRYRGRNPRQFHEKYKELQPERYADDVAKVVASGKTPAGTHRPIMVREILEVLSPQPGDTAVDCTLGYGGHARELLAAVQPGGRLLAVDADPVELPKTEARLRTLGFPPESLLVQRMNYAGVAQWLAEVAPDGVDVLLADLGLSSMQLDDPTRGFTCKTDGPLDMRMNPKRGLSAADWLAKVDATTLSASLAENADEPQADRLAAAIVTAQQRRPLVTTQQLADVVRRTVADEDAVRRVFQAIRIVVNDEFAALAAFLRQLPQCLKPGGRVAILSFHSGEDRRVKQAFKDGLRASDYSEIAPEIIRPSREEQHSNPRSSSAKLRFAIRSG